MGMINHNLSIFINVADSGSVTETANSLYISQPAVSKAVIQLEQELGIKLFHRNKRRGLILTDAGRTILRYAHQMQELENHILQTAYQEKNFLGGRLRIASFPIVTSTLLSKAIHQYRQQYPQVELELLDRDPKTVQRLVEDHAVDFGISTSPYGRVDHELLFVDRMVGIGLPGESLPEQIDLFGGTKNLIFCDAGKETTIETLKGSQAIRFSDSLIVQNHETIINMVEEGNGIGVISEYTLNAIPNDLVRFPVVPPVEIEVSLVAPSLSDLTPVAQEFVRILKVLVRQTIHAEQA